MIDRLFSRILIHCHLIPIKIRKYRLISTSGIVMLEILLVFANSAVLSGQKSSFLNPTVTENSFFQVTNISDKTGHSALQQPIEEFLETLQSIPGEKVYLHLDRPDYLEGDTIWFKAYSWFDLKPDTSSRILYVDLLDKSGRIKLKRKVLIQQGISHGDFSLDSTISPGVYIIRAYTRWMQNPDSGEPFYKKVIINPVSENFQVICTPVILKYPGKDSLKIEISFFEIDPSGDLKTPYSHEAEYSLEIGDKFVKADTFLTENNKQQVFKYSLSGIDKNDKEAYFSISINDKQLKFKKQYKIPLQEGIDIQFFPEGGSLVNEMKSRIAFKAIGSDGLSREVKGIIETEEEEFVTGFESTHKGMGYFYLKPETGKKYLADLWYDGRKYLVPLPDASVKGTAMTIRSDFESKNVYLTLKCIPFEANIRKYIIGTSAGQIRFSASVRISNDSCQVRIPLELLTEGVCRITVLSENFDPECERLIYVDKNQRFNVEVIPDSSSYSHRSKVALTIKTTGADGIPVQTNLSLAVLDKEQISFNEFVPGITDYKLLESELKGYIEDLGSYFNSKREINQSLLDLLMLTQGYRKFVPVKEAQRNVIHDPENVFDISGSIIFNGNKSREKKFKCEETGLTLMCKSDDFFIDQSKPDSTGKFRFEIPLMNGKIHSLLQVKNANGKPFSGDIILSNSVDELPFKTPIIPEWSLTSHSIENVIRLQMVKKTETSKTPWYGAMSVSLGEVVVRAKAKNWYRNFENEALKIANLDSMDPSGKRYKNLNELLIKEFGAKERILRWGGNLTTVILPCISMGADYWFPIYVVNGNTSFTGGERADMFLANLNHISYLPVNEIKKIMVLPPAKISSYYADMIISTEIKQSLVVIETYNDSYRGDPGGIKSFIMDGLDAPRLFYSPKYEGPALKSPVFDGRSTLCWEPIVRTDSTGKAKVEFFTSDRSATLRVIVNGVEIETGNPGQSITEIYSSVKK